eukprot:scaffold9076_cov36-Prasinocladus_malaysianus.AAC.1
MYHWPGPRQENSKEQAFLFNLVEVAKAELVDRLTLPARQRRVELHIPGLEHPKRHRDHSGVRPKGLAGPRHDLDPGARPLNGHHGAVEPHVEAPGQSLHDLRGEIPKRTQSAPSCATS